MEAGSIGSDVETKRNKFQAPGKAGSTSCHQWVKYTSEEEDLRQKSCDWENLTEQLKPNQREGGHAQGSEHIRTKSFPQVH